MKTKTWENQSKLDVMDLNVFPESHHLIDRYARKNTRLNSYNDFRVMDTEKKSTLQMPLNTVFMCT